MHNHLILSSMGWFFMKDKRNKIGLDALKTNGKGIIEDATEYGEFIASFDAWLTPEEQKRRARYLENSTDKDE